MTAEVMNNQNHKKFIPILKYPSFKEATPSWLMGKYYIDLSASPYSENQYSDLLTTLLRKRPVAPPIGYVTNNETKSDAKEDKRISQTNSQLETIRINGVIVDQVGSPRNDGTRGSALYEVPFRLSERPPHEWAKLFVQVWNSPPRFTTMHRPGIASVIGDKVILDGTTLEEVEKYHRETLILVCTETNKKYQDLINKKRRTMELEQKRLEEHKRNVEDAARRIKFDDDA